ncbi:MAG: DUF4835 family protein [Bacteroidota bacterium]
MQKLFFISALLLSGFFLKAQEFDCNVTVDAKQTGKMQLSIFNSLETALQEFVNGKRWSDINITENHQKINCNIFILITDYDDDRFKASIQFQSSRPIFGSTASTPILNVNDRSFSFDYTENQPLNYNSNTFETNLVSVVAYYLYTALGLDADTFELMSGDQYYEEAQRIVNSARSANANGWSDRGGSSDFSRFNVNRDLLSSSFSDFREALYIYHRKGLDQMHDDVELGKTKIIEALDLIEKNYKARPGASLVRVFFDAKSNEIYQILDDGPKIELQSIIKTLNEIAPVHNRLWKEL